MNNLQVFEFNGDTVRTVVIEDNVWFVGVDVCNILEHTNPSVAYSRLKEYEKKLVDPKQYLGSVSNQNVTIISESGLYRLVLTSRKPQAEPFQDWVVQEVLPTIRKTGSYSLPAVNKEDIIEQFSLPKNYVEALKYLVVAEEQKVILESQVTPPTLMLRIQAWASKYRYLDFLLLWVALAVDFSTAPIPFSSTDCNTVCPTVVNPRCSIIIAAATSLLIVKPHSGQL